MKPVVTIVPAGMDHIASIAARMREADRVEVWASSRSTPHQSLMISLQNSRWAMTALVDGQPEVMWGVADLNILTGTGAPWLLGTDAVEVNYRLFLRHSLQWKEKLSEQYQVLMNFVHDENEVSKRWLKWLGFTLSEPFELGRDGELFRMFEMRR